MKTPKLTVWGVVFEMLSKIALTDKEETMPRPSKLKRKDS